MAIPADNTKNFVDAVPPRNDYRNMARNISNHFEDKKLLFQVVAGGAIGEYELLETGLNEFGVRYDSYNSGALMPEAYGNNGEFRPPIKPLRIAIRQLKNHAYEMNVNPRDADSLIVMEDAVVSSRSAIGGLTRGLEIAKHFGIPEVYLAAIVDIQGICHFSHKYGTNPIPLKSFLLNNKPKTYQEYQERGLLDLISDYTPSSFDRIPDIGASLAQIEKLASEMADGFHARATKKV